MSIANITVSIHDAIQRHASQLEEINLLPVLQCDPMIWVRQADKWNSFILPVMIKSRRRVRSHCHDYHAAIIELVILIPQARQLRATVWSLKTAQERQYDWPASKIG